MNKSNQQKSQLKLHQVFYIRKVTITEKPPTVFLNRILSQYVKLRLKLKRNLIRSQLRLQKFKKKKLKCNQKRL